MAAAVELHDPLGMPPPTQSPPRTTQALLKTAREKSAKANNIDHRIDAIVSSAWSDAERQTEDWRELDITDERCRGLSAEARRPRGYLNGDLEYPLWDVEAVRGNGTIARLASTSGLEVQYSSQEAHDWSENGSCGFTASVQQLPKSLDGFGMCHHFTFDGQHCVSAGLGSEHANRCAGRMCSHWSCGVADARPKTGAWGCQSLLCDSGASRIRDLDLRHIFCGPPGGRCTATSCPFLAQSKPCPYGTTGAFGEGLFRL
jgi:hypothetical protein